MKTILLGIMDSNIGGVNRFILDFLSQHKDENFIILTNAPVHKSYMHEIPENITIELIISVLHPIKLYLTTRKIIKNYNIDTLYLNISTNLFYPVLKAAYDCNVRERIIHSHSSYSADSSFIKRNAIVAINKLLRKKMNKLSTNRKACSDKAAEWLFGKNVNFDFVYNKVKKQKFIFNPTQRNLLRKDLEVESLLIIGFVGGFNYPKNISYFLNIAKKLSKCRNDFCIIMLGDGELKISFEKKIKKMSLEKYFKLLGNKSNVNEYYNIFDCFVMPSRFEGLPIVGVEAQINGLKCYFSDRITKQAKITQEAEYFSLRNVSKLVRKIASMKIGEHKNTPLINFNNFLIKEDN